MCGRVKTIYKVIQLVISRAKQGASQRFIQLAGCLDHAKGIVRPARQAQAIVFQYFVGMVILKKSGES